MKKIVLITIAILSLLSVSAQQKKKNMKNMAKEKKVYFMPIPFVMSNPTYGTSFGAMGAFMYKLNKEDLVSPMSKSSFMGMYGINKSYTWWINQEFYFNENRTRVILNLGSSHIPVKYMYDDGDNMSYNENIFFIRAKALQRFANNFYAGLYYNYTPQDFLDYTNNTKDKNIMVDDITQSTIGVMATYDSRDYIFYPTKGYWVTIYLSTTPKFLGSTDNFSALNYSVIKYFPMADNDILALRLYGVNKFGNVPYGALAMYGVSTVDLVQVDLRGYMRGKYRGKNQIDIQAEYRLNFSGKLKRFGLAANIGSGRIWDTGDLEEIYGGKNVWLPSFGGGLRFNLIPKKHMNLRLDYNYGIHGNHALYLGLYEAF
ncbi:BamA/TamA family outer membrane protein [Tenacibaculum sp. UWU-22]|uniref:BamA/TamA family outer membrane protein n=1 Tax=Tenacibaculum sp. UWU-22 TaxID=3234187 RepID=UPI0034DB7188